MQIILYTLIVFFATVIGAATGTGGGAVIKPMFDAVGLDTAATIGVYSTIAVFVMCISSIIKSVRNGLSFELNILLSLSLGSVLGGILGELIFNYATQIIPNHTVTLLQSIGLLLVLLTLILFTQFNVRIRTFKFRNPIFLFVIGSLVGAFSVFLGIGGGPLNIIALVGLMSHTPKSATVYSLSMIFFSQIPKIINLVFNRSVYSFNATLVPLIVLAAILGGIIGTYINHRLTDKQIKLLYLVMIVFLLMTCIFNITRNF